MGMYLFTGIVQHIFVNRETTLKSGLTLDNLTAELRQSVNIAYFDFSEDQEYYYWHLKPTVLEGNLAEFLEMQYRMYEGEIDQEEQTVLERVRLAKNGDEIITLASSKELTQFKLVTNITDCLRIKRDNGFDAHAKVRYHLMAFFMDGKIIMECYDNILNYFEKNIRLQKMQYPIAECVRVMISD